jgi:hypothetical protein
MAGAEVAFGLSPFLHQFAQRLNAAPYWKWAQEGISRQAVLPRNMHEAFEEMVQKVISGQVTRIHFNLDGISDPLASADFAKSSLEAQLSAGLPVSWMSVGLTNAELNAIRNDPQLLRITVFYRQGKVVPSPF